MSEGRHTCPHCGMPVEPDAHFCSQCGEQIVAPPEKHATSFCPQCGSPVEADSAFCAICGAALAPAAPVEPVVPAGPSEPEVRGGAEAAELGQTAQMWGVAEDPEFDAWSQVVNPQENWNYEQTTSSWDDYNYEQDTSAWDDYSYEEPVPQPVPGPRKTPVTKVLVGVLCALAVVALAYFVPRLQRQDAQEPAGSMSAVDAEEGTSAEEESPDDQTVEGEEGDEVPEANDEAPEQDGDAKESEGAKKAGKADQPEKSAKEENDGQAEDKDAQAEAEPSKSESKETKDEGEKETVAAAAEPTTPEPTDEVEGAYPPSFPWVDASSEQSAAGYASSSYSPAMARDKDPRTAWIEAAYGPGEGEWIRVSADAPQRVSGVSIMAGFPKSGDIYYANYRPRQVRIELSDGYVQEATLADSYREYQEIRFDHTHPATWVRVIIESVYDTNHWTDTAIAEIDVF